MATHPPENNLTLLDDFGGTQGTPSIVALHGRLGGPRSAVGWHSHGASLQLTLHGRWDWLGVAPGLAGRRLQERQKGGDTQRNSKNHWLAIVLFGMG